MALVAADRVKETTVTTGTGTYSLGGASEGFQSFSDVLSDSDTAYYGITDNTEWEVGIGTFTVSGTTLARTVVLSSSNSDNAVDWGSGVKDIFLTYPADKVVYKDASGSVALPTVDINGGTIDGAAIGESSAAAGTFTTLNADGGGALTGTWADLGSVGTIDINGGTVDGVTIGASSASAATVTTLTVNTSATMELDQISSTSDLPVSLGGTGASTQSAARTNLGLGTAAVADTTDFDAAGTALALSIALG